MTISFGLLCGVNRQHTGLGQGARAEKEWGANRGGAKTQFHDGGNQSGGVRPCRRAGVCRIAGRHSRVPPCRGNQDVLCIVYGYRRSESRRRRPVWRHESRTRCRDSLAPGGSLADPRCFRGAGAGARPQGQQGLRHSDHLDFRDAPRGDDRHRRGRAHAPRLRNRDDGRRHQEAAGWRRRHLPNAAEHPG